MRCHSCDYELWHCTGRICPECGDSFLLKDYFFEKNTVLFHCPHCDHGITGTTQSGLPSVSVEHCEACGQAIGLEMYVVRPIDEHAKSFSGSLLPNRLRDGNWFTRYFKTVWLVMTKPQVAINRVPVHEPLFYAWKFFITTLCITLSVGMIPVLLLFMFVSLGGTNLGGPNQGIGALMIVPILAIQVAIGVIAVLLYVILWTLGTHFMLHLTGGSAHTIRRTMQSILYGGGASLVNIVPCIGGFAGGIWWIVSSINMIARGQRVGGGRASVATLTTPIICFLCVCSGYVLLIFAVMSPALANAKSIAQQAQQQAKQRATLMAQPSPVEEAVPVILDQP